MTTFPDMVYQLGGAPLLSGVPFSGNSRVFFVDPANGSDSYEGTSPERAKKSLKAAYDLTISGQNDVIFFIGGASGDTVTAEITWANNYTHLIGISAPLPGLGQRCRVTASAAADVVNVITISGSGCHFSNIQFANWSDANVDSGAAVVSGSRNVFTNVFFAGMGHATPGARAGSYSLTVSGSENHFERCTIGLQTIVRAAANAELVISGGATDNRFWDCEFISFSDTEGKLAVLVSAMDRRLEFKDCLFFNFSTNWSVSLTNAISDLVATTHYIVLRGANQFVGFSGIADTVTRIYGAGPAPNAGMFMSTNPTT